MYKNILFFLLIFLGLMSKSFAQGSVTGCLLPNNTVYSNDFMGNASYYEYTSPFTPLSNNYCYWTPGSTGVSCNVCTGYINLGIFGYLPVGCTTGIKGTFTMVMCPIDSNVLFLMGVSTFLGFFMIRKKWHTYYASTHN